MLIYSIDDLPHGGRETGNEQRYRGRRVHCCQPGRDSGRGADRPRLLTGDVTWRRRRRTMSIWEDSVQSRSDSRAMPHKFKIGDIVKYRPTHRDRRTPTSECTVIALLPETDGTF